MTIDNFISILEIFPKDWFESNENKNHPLYILNEQKKYDFREYFDIFDRNLQLLKEKHLISKDLKTKLLNPTQFEDTLIEVKVATILSSNGIRVELPPTFPDIQIPDWNTIIEVKNLHTSDKLVHPIGEYASEVDDIKRIWDIISERILPKLDSETINLILINVPPIVDFNEFADLLVYCKRSREGGVKYTINWKTKQVILRFNGEFSNEENKDISAVIMMKDNYFKGIINPLNKAKIPDDLTGIFNLQNIEFTE